MKKIEGVDVVLEGLDETDINSLLGKWDEVISIKKKLEELEDMIRTKIKVYLKERKWERYVDKVSKISVTISKQTKEKVDKVQMKHMLTPAQYSLVINTITVEKMIIMTPETRKKMKKFIK